jgi:Circadian oscillating protein COP23
MKVPLFLSILATTAISLGATATFSQPGLAQTESNTYFCGRSSDGVWTTFAKNYNNKKIPIIRWVRTLGEYTPQVRCREVSARFQSAYSKKILNFLTTGISFGQAVICATSEHGGPCNQILFTLKSPKQASSVVQSLIDLGYRARGPILQSGGASQEYVDMNMLLNQEPTEGTN